MKSKWYIVHESDDENGNPSVWTCGINHKKYEQDCWIDDHGGYFSFDVVRRRNSKFTELAQYKFLISAKRLVARYFVINTDRW